MTEKVGYIPESVIYVCRKPTAFTTHWNGESWYSRSGEDRSNISLDLSNATQEQATLFQKDVISTFPVSADPKNLESRMLTARQWASGVYYGRWNKSPLPDAHKEIIKENKPFTVQIVGLDVRSEGGRAYKVVDTEGHMFDLREDIAFETLMKEGCSPNGHLNCQFLWGVVRSSMKLIRENSLLHQALLRASDRRTKEVIPVTDLIPGRVYQAKNLDKKIFVGWIPAPRAKAKYRQVWLDACGYGYLTGYANGGRNIHDQQIVANYIREFLKEGRAPSEYYLSASISTEHKMVEEIADHSQIIDLLLQYAIGRLSSQPNDYIKSLDDIDWSRSDVSDDQRKKAKKNLAKAKKDLQEIQSIQTSLETADV